MRTYRHLATPRLTTDLSPRTLRVGLWLKGGEIFLLVGSEMTQIYVGSAIVALRELHKDLLARPNYAFTIHDSLATQADALLGGHSAGNRAVTFHLGSWCPGFIGTQPDEMMAMTLTLEQARLTIAKEHGYPDWATVEALHDTEFDENFEQSIDAVVEGNLAELKARLTASPDLAKQRSQYGHRASLLHYVGANGVESYRQMVPLNAPDVAQLLIDAGADVNAEANMYGGGATTLGLVESSAHPHNAGIGAAIVQVLKAAGAT